MAAPSDEAAIDSIVRTACFIRAFESRLLSLFAEDRLSGTVHTCIGQELCAAALHPHLNPAIDAFFGTHRSHGHYLASGAPPDRLLAELMGREGALCHGRGGTQHLYYERFFSSGIQGGSAPVAVGFAWALRHKGERAIAVIQIGDGTLGEGTLYEAFTFAVLRKVPVLFLLEYNGWAQSTDVTTTTPGDLLSRANGFGLSAHRISDDDVPALYEQLKNAVRRVRAGEPFLQVIDTRRLMAHSKGDDNRSKEYIELLRKKDPLTLAIQTNPVARAAMEQAEIDVEALVRNVSTRPLISENASSALPPSQRKVQSRELSSLGRNLDIRVSDSLNRALHSLMESSRDVFLIGEDLADPYGGAFKVSRGLSTRFPDRVFSTPIAEAAIVGCASGLALGGARPIAELMFGDFVTLATDQIINFAAKMFAMYGGQVTCPVTVRVVSGARRGYGPTHSQSLERLYCGIPGLRVVALSRHHDPARLLTEAVTDEAPTLFIENKQLYAETPLHRPPLDLVPIDSIKEQGNYPPLGYRPADGHEADVTVVTYGGMTSIVEAAMKRQILERELRFDYIVLTQLWPLDASDVIASVKQTRRLIVAEEGVADYGIGAAVLAAVAQSINGGFRARLVGARPVPIPSARHLEDAVLPSADSIFDAISALFD